MKSKKIKSIILALILGAISLLILIPFTSFIIAVIGGLIGAIIAFILGYNFFKEKIVEDIKSDLKAEPKKLDPSTHAIESLIELEEFIALSDSTLEKELGSKVSYLIDTLIAVVPKMNSSFSSQAITFEVSNLADEHFPNRIKAFLNLSENDQNSQKLKLLADLQKMEEVVNKVTVIIDNDSLNKDERESLLAEIKYGAI
mgnify:CR=1 FL=1